ncbi:MAG: TspO/MBR family protein [Patescibacteria group bacterium]
MSKQNFVKLIISIALCLLAGVLGSIFTTPQINTWYATLIKPIWSPANNWFGPVWTLLFILMGVAAYYIWEEIPNRAKAAKSALLIFYIHLLANTLWSFLFFGLNNPGLGFIWIIILWLLILITMIKFWQVKKLAALILLPYLFWVSFAAYLNFVIWRLN